MTPDVEFLIACGALDDLLDDAERERLTAALAADPHARARLASVSKAYAALRAEPEPTPTADLWERIQGSVAAGELPGEGEDEDDAPDEPLETAATSSVDPTEISIALACSYCHGTLVRREAAYCASCLAPHHGECFSLHARCAAPGCGETHWVRAEAPAAEPRKPLRRGLLLVLGLGALAGAAFSVVSDRGGAAPAPSEPPAASITVLSSDLALDLPVPDPGIQAQGKSALLANVVATGPSWVTLNVGSDDGVQRGDVFHVLTDPQSHDPSWEVRVSVVARDVSRAERVHAFSPYAPIVGDWATPPASEPLTPLPPGEFHGADVAAAQACATCHEDPHAGTFVADCSACHETAGWEATRTSAPLTPPPRVSYLTGAPSLDYRYLVKHLERTAGVRLRSFLESADPEWEPPTSAGLEPLRRVPERAEGDLLILGPTRDAILPANLSDFVRQGGGLILLAEGGGLVREFGAEGALLAPVEDRVAPGVAALDSESSTPRSGAAFAPLEGVAVDKLPLRASRPARLRPSAKALLTDGQGTPLIAEWTWGRGRVVYVGTSELWKLQRLPSPDRDSATLYDAVWRELLRRATSRSQAPAFEVQLDTLLAPARLSSLKGSGGQIVFDLFRLGARSLTKAERMVAALHDGVQGPTAVFQSPRQLTLLPGRYAWQATGVLAGVRTLVGLGWVNVTGVGSPLAADAEFLELTPRELQARLLCALAARRPGQAAAERVSVRNAAVAWLADSPPLAEGGELLQGLADGSRDPDESALRSLCQALGLEEAAQADLFTRESAAALRGLWRTFEAAEGALLESDAWFEAAVREEILPRVRRDDAQGLHSALTPPWNYLLGQLPGPITVDPGLAILPGSVVDPALRLQQDVVEVTDSGRSALRLARRAEGAQTPRERAALYATALSRPLGRAERLAARVEALELHAQAPAEGALPLDPRVHAELVALSRIVGASPAAPRVRALLAQQSAVSPAQRRVERDFSALHEALKLYKLNAGRYPEGLRSLIAKDGPEWNGPYLAWPGGSRSAREEQPEVPDAAPEDDLGGERFHFEDPLPADPWGHPYRYARDGNGYTLSTLGADGAPGGTGEARDLIGRR